MHNEDYVAHPDLAGVALDSLPEARRVGTVVTVGTVTAGAAGANGRVLHRAPGGHQCRRR